MSDNGPGIPEGDRSRVVDRFVRLEQSRSQPGSGLGLSLVSAVARLAWRRAQARGQCARSAGADCAAPRRHPAATGGVTVPEMAASGPARGFAARVVALTAMADAAGRERVADWLAEIAGTAEAAILGRIVTTHPAIRTLLDAVASSSPYLWDLRARRPGAARHAVAGGSRRASGGAGWRRPRARSPPPAPPPRRCACCAPSRPRRRS